MATALASILALNSPGTKSMLEGTIHVFKITQTVIPLDHFAYIGWQHIKQIDIELSHMPTDTGRSDENLVIRN